MARRPGQQGSGKGPRDTRVYAPTHRAAGNSGTSGKQAGNVELLKDRTSPQKKKEHPEEKRPRTPAQQYATVRFAARDKETPSGSMRQQQEQRRKQAEDGAVYRKKSRRKTKGYESIHRLEPIENHERKLNPNKRKRPHDKRRMLNALLAVIILAALLSAGYFVFLLEEIVVEGNEAYTSGSIIELSALTPGRHMLLNSIANAKANLESNPYIKVVEIKREFPRTIRIVVQERKEAAAIALQGTDVIIDMEGYVLSIGSGSDLTGLMRIDGMSQLGFKVNQQLGPASDMQVQSLILLLKNLQHFSLAGEVASIDLSNPLRLLLKTTDGLWVILGQADNLEEKFGWMRDALPSLKMSGLEGGVLDVSAKNGAIYMPPDQAGDVQPDGDDAPDTEDNGDDDISTPDTPSQAG